MARALFVALVCACALAACQPSGSPDFHGVDLTGADYGQKWKLVDSEGQARTLEDYRGQVLLVYFGFIHCPDICPVTLGHLKEVVTQLGPQSDKVRVLFVTVDAENDTPQAMHDYLANFGPRFTGLTGSEDSLALAARDFKVYAKKKDLGGTMGFEHAGFVYALDAQGRPRVLYGPDTKAADMAADVQILLKG